MNVGAAMVLAAGLGTRMRPLTDATPKALLRVAGVTLLDRALAQCRRAGARRIVVNAHHHADQMRSAVAGAGDVALSDESDGLLDTGGGVAKALPLLGPGAFLALNADAVWTGPDPAAPLLGGWDAARMDALMLLVPRARALAYSRPGDFTLGADGRPARRTGETAPWVYTGAQILHPRAFEAAPGGAFSMNRVWDRALAAGRLFAVVHDGGWVDVGTPAGLAAAEAALA